MTAAPPATMRAVALDDFGAPPALRELPVPQPGPGEVLVRVQASSVNGFDGAVAAGYLRGMMEYRFPVVLGKDVAGTVAALGAGAARFGVGDRVFGVVMPPALGPGGWGEYVAVAEGFLAAVLPALDLATAGALGLAGAAALAAVDAVAPTAGEPVLIAGATGGVGALAIQLAKARGATVLATARPGDGGGLRARARRRRRRRLHGRPRGRRARAAPRRRAGRAPPGRRPGRPGRPRGARGPPRLHAGLHPGRRRGRPADRRGRSWRRPTPPRSSGSPARPPRGACASPCSARTTLAEAPQALADFGRGTLGKLAVRVH